MKEIPESNITYQLIPIFNEAEQVSSAAKYPSYEYYGEKRDTYVLSAKWKDKEAFSARFGRYSGLFCSMCSECLHKAWERVDNMPRVAQTTSSQNAISYLIFTWDDSSLP
ncbi:hypothetical protein MANES_14G089700v8 [Manihot esculenta]|uniref:Uncharacterized protein n=1 Tax=Manihot esculenta TaxID=3983 RepID=A0A2C9UL43_MANES|nr:hypothetical protein MANES_14G089700v8 [Manihot esculenta]